jgi:uncharacterized protein (TIGR04255 family)
MSYMSDHDGNENAIQPTTEREQSVSDAPKISGFKPVNDDHAIERVTFVVGFSRAFTSEELSDIRRHHSLWSSDLPAHKDTPGFTLTFDADGPRAEAISGVEFAFSRPDGSAVWALRFIGPNVSVECTRYTRWAKIWSSAHAHLSKALELIGKFDDAPTPSKLQLNVTDVFVAADSDAQLTAVFKDSDLIPKAATKFGSDWHSHTGWFEENANNRILHNLNIDAASERGDGSEGARISLLHVLTADVSDTSLSELSDHMILHMETLHQANKAVMGALLTEEIATRISLGTSTQ